MARRTSSNLSASFVDGATVSGSNFTDIFDSTFNLENTGISKASGSLDILGTLFAEKLKVSSSVIYGSGSTIFGDEMTDSHQFTGSVSITGSQTITGGTLTINADPLLGIGMQVHGPGSQKMEISSSDGNATLFVKSALTKDAKIDFEESEENRWVIGCDGTNDSFKITAKAFSDAMIEMDHATGSDGYRTVSMSAHLIPSSHSVYSLGSPSMKWKDLYLSTGSLYLGNVQLGASEDDAFMLTGSGVQYFQVESSDDRAGIDIQAGADNKNSNIFYNDFKGDRMFTAGARRRGAEGDLFYIATGSDQTDHFFIMDTSGDVGIGHGFFGNKNRPTGSVHLSGSSINLESVAVLVTGSLIASGSVIDFTNATVISGSTFSGSTYYGDGSNLTGVSAFPFVGGAQITGSLSISGSFIPSGHKGVENVVIGELAGLNAISDANIFIGYNAGNSLTHAGSTMNVAIGKLAMGGGGNSSTENVAIGTQALANINGGDYNTAVGNVAGDSISSGQYNTIVGYQAGYALTDGDYNVLIGSGIYNNASTTSGVAGLTNTLRIGAGTVIAISGSLTTGDLIFLSTASAAYFSGDGSNLTNLQRPITSSNVVAGLTASSDNAGYYFTVGGNITCSIQANATVAVPTGAEYEFFQTSSAGNFSFLTGSGVTFYSKGDALTLTGQYSAASLKKIDTDTWTLVGDLA